MVETPSSASIWKDIEGDVPTLRHNPVMFTALIAALSLAPVTYDLEPIDNVWVYAHAPDPAGDIYLRCWGAEGKSVAPNTGEAEEFSYSYLRFDLAGLPTGKKPTAATLTLTHIGNVGWTEDYAKANPLEARAITGTFTEKSWNFDQVATIHPDGSANGLWGWLAPTDKPKEGQELKVVINLAKTDQFSKALLKAMDSKSISMALTSSMEPSAIDGKSIYKVFSRYADKARRPVLHLEFE